MMKNLRTTTLVSQNAHIPDSHGPALRFTPTAWARLLFLRDAGPTEIAAFGITPADDLLLVEQIVTVPQQTTIATVAFGDQAVADFFDEQIDAGRKPEQFARIWIHTHPGDSAEPSSVDEATFTRVFGGCDWAVMFILARGGATYSRLRFNAGPGGALLLPVEIDFDAAFAASDRPAWLTEYERNVTVRTTNRTRRRSNRPLVTFDEHDLVESPSTGDPFGDRDEFGIGHRRSPLSEHDADLEQDDFREDPHDFF